MSIKLTLSIGAVKTEASLKDAAYNDIMALIFKHQDGAIATPNVRGHSSVPEKSDSIVKGESIVESVKSWLSKHTASEVLNRIGWETNPGKILLLGAYHESNGGSEGWRSADMSERFDQAREPFPGNFPRDIRAAIDEGVIGAVTPRTYKVGRAGWNKIAESISALDAN